MVLWYLNSSLIHSQQAGTPGTSVLHWHAHAVTSLAFSVDGTYLISGGHEAVLVTWQLGTRNRSFLPRLGGAIVAISVSPPSADGIEATFAVSLDDNTVRLASAVSGQVTRTLRGISIPLKDQPSKVGKKKRQRETEPWWESSPFVFDPSR
eukprot:SAG31_NODE_8030_length_1537_cov_1.116134_2_plen_150_part_01